MSNIPSNGTLKSLNHFLFRPATPEEEQTTILGLKEHTAKAGGINTKDQPFAVLCHRDNELIGSVIGKVFWNWLYLDLLWVHENHRGHRLGIQLMLETETKAKQDGLTGIYLWTETWQAPDFYKKLGYEKFIEFEDFPPGYKRFGFRKYLS